MRRATHRRSGSLEVIADALRGGATALLRSRVVTRAADRHFKDTLRVLTYHTVPDADRFAAHVELVASRYRPVGVREVIAAVDGAPLPHDAVWITFDDGDPSVVRHALPALVRAGVSATMFVCPGVIESGEPLWPARVEQADLRLLGELLPVHIESAADAIAHLKIVDDTTRRAVIRQLPLPEPAGPSQLTSDQLERWLDAGMDVGSHSWDHPCLDRCAPDEQVRQVDLADRWLRDRIAGWTPTFAYPNGNASDVVAGELAARGYAVAVLHDHRLARSLDHRYRVSRLHVDAGDDVDRLRGVVSGAQPAVAAVAASLRQAYAGATRPR